LNQFSGRIDSLSCFSLPQIQSAGKVGAENSLFTAKCKRFQKKNLIYAPLSNLRYFFSGVQIRDIQAFISQSSYN